MKPERTRQLFRRGKRVKGWLTRGGAALLGLLDEAQKLEGVQGDLFEIGAFHGKSALLLGGMLDPERERLGVCDLFGTIRMTTGEDLWQAAHEGRVDTDEPFRDVFLGNFHAVHPDPKLLHVHTKLSSDLTPADVGTCRLIHIDGAHAHDAVLADVELAARCLHERGLVVLDDAFTHAHPGVTEAIVHFLDAHPDLLRPVVLGHHKMALAPPTACPAYKARIASPEFHRPYFPGRDVTLTPGKLCGLEAPALHAGKRRLWSRLVR